MTETLPRARRFALPRAGETLESIAAREFPDRPRDTVVSDLRSWNLHLQIRVIGPPGLLPSDVVFLEPPLPRA